MSDALEFSVRINMDDYVDWSIFLQRRRKAPPAKSRIVVLSAWAFVGFSLFWLAAWLVDWIVTDARLNCAKRFPTEDLALLALAPIFLALVAYGAYAAFAARNYARTQLRAMMAGVNASTDDLPVSWSLDEGRIVITTPDATSTFQWSAIKRAEETDTHLFLISDFAAALIAPKRNLAPPTLEALRALLRSKGKLA